MKKNIFITGATGFLGVRLVEFLSKNKNLVLFCLIRDKKKKLLLPNKSNVKFVYGDINNKNLHLLVPKKIDTIFHLAALQRNSNYKLCYQVNVEGTRNIIKIAKHIKVKKIIFTSSVNTYLINKGAYAKTKILAENELKNSKIPTIIFKPALIFGPNDAAIAKMLKFIVKLPVVPVIGDGKKLEQPIYIEEIIELMSLCINREVSGHETYNAAGKDMVSFNNLLRILENALNKNKPPSFSNKKKKHLHLPFFMMITFAKLVELFFPKLGFTSEQMYHVNENTTMDLRKTWNTFTYKHYDLKETLEKLIQEKKYDL
jgi:nucleoside-diphosphate-sugar epimerase